jgi:hypothetical protein
MASLMGRANSLSRTDDDRAVGREMKVVGEGSLPWWILMSQVAA